MSKLDPLLNPYRRKTCGNRKIKPWWGKLLQLHNLPLPIKIFLNHLILLFIPVTLIYFLVFDIYTNDKKSEALDLVNRVNRQALANIDSYLFDLEELTKQPLYEPEIINLLSSLAAPTAGPTTPSRNRSNFAPPDFSHTTDHSITIMLNRLMAFKPFIHSVFLFNLSGSGVYRMKDNLLLHPYNPVNETWFSQCLSLKGSPLIQGSLRFKGVANPIAPEFYLFSVSRAIMDSTCLHPAGVLSIYADINFLRDICHKTRTFKGEAILIADGSDQIVYSLDEANIGHSLNHSPSRRFFYRQVRRTRNRDSFKYQNQKYLVNILTSQLSNWRLIRVIPENSLYSSIRSVQQQWLWSTLLFVCLSLLLSVSMSYRVTTPLQKLMATMRRVERGDLSVRFKTRYEDEVGHLGRTFNRMITQIDHLINQVHASELRKQQAELNALQAQINPHYIYNTLESIRMTAELNDDPETAKMITLLGNLLRYSVNQQNQIVTLAQELEHLQNYLRLQDYRFKGRYRLQLEIPEELLGVPMIKLLLQPLVENSIYHGMKHLTAGGIFTIRGFLNPLGLCLQVEDNGSGMAAEQVAKLNRTLSTMESTPVQAGGLGMTNVNERIKLTYGMEYGLQIQSEIGVGATVTLQLPPPEQMALITNQQRVGKNHPDAKE